jgi:hypothetical protein
VTTWTQIDANRLTPGFFHHHTLHRLSLTAAWARALPPWALVHLYQAFCGLRGHELVRHFEPGRLLLQCIDCGWESPGWTVSEPLLRSRPRALATKEA